MSEPHLHPRVHMIVRKDQGWMRNKEVLLAHVGCKILMLTYKLNKLMCWALLGVAIAEKEANQSKKEWYWCQHISLIGQCFHHHFTSSKKEWYWCLHISLIIGALPHYSQHIIGNTFLLSFNNKSELTHQCNLNYQDPVHNELWPQIM